MILLKELERSYMKMSDRAEALLLGESCENCHNRSSEIKTGRCRCVYDERGERHRASFRCKRWRGPTILQDGRTLPYCPQR
jgi:hypothetical protein